MFLAPLLILQLLPCVHAVCALFAGGFVRADVCTCAIWNVGIATLCLHAIFCPFIRWSWSDVSALLQCIQVCSFLGTFCLAFSYSEGCAGREKAAVSSLQLLFAAGSFPAFFMCCNLLLLQCPPCNFGLLLGLF